MQIVLSYCISKQHQKGTAMVTEEEFQRRRAAEENSLAAWKLRRRREINSAEEDDRATFQTAARRLEERGDKIIRALKVFFD